MSGRIFGKVIALCGAGLRYVIKGAGRSVTADTLSTALTKSRPGGWYSADVKRGVFAEIAPIVCAVLIAMALGVASGLWINTGLASPPSESADASAQSPPSVHATEQTIPAPSNPIRNRPDDSDVPSQAAAEAAHLADSDEPPSASEKSTNPDEADGGASQAAGADAATANARDERASAKTDGRTSGGEARSMGGRATGRSGPCTLSTDASSLSIRGGGGIATITLRLNGMIGPARVTAATPNWADVVVFAASQTSGNGGSVLWYTIKSVSRRAGIYRVGFTTPCGTKTIPVMVTQP
jgi:hypothetical protein